MLSKGLLVASVLALVGCGADAPMPTASHQAHQNGLALSNLTSASSAQALNDLRRLSAPFHDVDAAEASGYGLLKAPPLTAPDGCISDATAGGMGYHYTRGNNLADDAVTLLDPEFLVYAPTNAPPKDGEAKARLAAFDYFLPYSAKWPGPDDPKFQRKPALHDFPSMAGLPDREFAPSRFGGWMFHIWLWENNPDGMFENWNKSVRLCTGSTF